MTTEPDLHGRPPGPPAPGDSAARHVPHRYRNLFTLTGVTVVDNTESGLASTLFPTIAAALRLDTGHLGILSALGKIAGVPAGPFLTWLAGRIGRRATLVLATTLGGSFGIIAGFAHGFAHLLVFNTLMSALIVGTGPLANAIIADSFDDTQRGKAAGYFYGISSLLGSFIGPLVALFSGFSDGWRYGMWTIGGICVLSGLAVAVLFRDPGVGASEVQLADLAAGQRVRTRVTVSSVASLFRIPTFSIMMLSRLLSGHLLITIFGVQFLVTERGFSNATAAVVLLPFGIGYFLGTVGGGWVIAVLDRVRPDRGRVTYLQVAQLGFAGVAALATQVHWNAGIGVYIGFWLLMGFFQGVNPPVNRPVVAAVILPELRGQGFAIWLSVFEAIGWGLFALGAGQLADSMGIQEVFLWVLVVLMVVNAVVLGALHFCYPRDVARVREALDARRREVLSS